MNIEQYQQLGAKKETTELTPIALTAPDYAIAWHEIGGVKAVNSMNERRLRRASFAPVQPVGGAYIGEASGTFEPVPSGTDGTAPLWYAFLEASGADIATDVATWGAQDTAYAPQGSTLTIIHRDGQWARTAAGARVESLTFKAKRGELWLCEMTAIGRYSEVSASSFLATALPTINGKPFLGHAVSVGGSAVTVSEIEIKIENVISPVEDGTHESGNGKNIITEQRLTATITVLYDGTDYFSKLRNIEAADLLDVSAQMSTGAAGNVLTWSGTMALMEDVEKTYIEGNGYLVLSGEFVATTLNAVLTLTQS